MKQVIVAPIIKCSVNEFKGNNNEDVKFCKITVVDEDAVTDAEGFETYNCSYDVAAAAGLTDPDSFREVIGKTFVLDGVKESRYDKDNKVWFKRFKIKDIKLLKK